MVLPGPGKPPAATTRRIFALSYDLWEERFAVTAVDARSQSVSHLALAAAEAWCVEQLAIPLSALGALGRDVPFWIRLEYRILDGEARVGSVGLGLHAAGAHRAVEPPEAGRRAEQTESSPHALEAGPFRMPARGRLRRDDSAQPPDRGLPRVNAAAARRNGLDYDDAPRPEPPVRDDRRARSALADAREHREAVLPAGTRRVETGRARGPDTARRCIDAADGVAMARGRPVVLGERRARALRRVRDQRRARGLHAARRRVRRPPGRRGLQP